MIPHVGNDFLSEQETKFFNCFSGVPLLFKAKSKTMTAKSITSIENHNDHSADMNGYCQLPASSLVGHHVQNKDRQWIGKIHNIMINVRSGRIEYIILEFQTFLGLSRKLFAVPFCEFTIMGDTCVVDRSIEYLKNAPGFDKSHWPKTNLHNYFHDIDLFFGTPALSA